MKKFCESLCEHEMIFIIKESAKEFKTQFRRKH